MKYLKNLKYLIPLGLVLLSFVLLYFAYLDKQPYPVESGSHGLRLKEPEPPQVPKSLNNLPQIIQPIVE